MKGPEQKPGAVDVDETGRGDRVLSRLARDRVETPPDLTARILSRLPAASTRRPILGGAGRRRTWGLAWAALAVVAAVGLTLWGPVFRPTQAGTLVDFSVHAPESGRVELIGTFTDWRADRVRLVGPDGSGRWRATLALAPGAYEYTFLVDGRPRVEGGPGWTGRDSYGHPVRVVVVWPAEKRGRAETVRLGDDPAEPRLPDAAAAAWDEHLDAVTRAGLDSDTAGRLVARIHQAGFEPRRVEPVFKALAAAARADAAATSAILDEIRTGLFRRVHHNRLNHNAARRTGQAMTLDRALDAAKWPGPDPSQERLVHHLMLAVEHGLPLTDALAVCQTVTPGQWEHLSASAMIWLELIGRGHDPERIRAHITQAAQNGLGWDEAAQVVDRAAGSTAR